MAGEVFHVSDGELFEPVDDEIGSSYWLTPASILDHCCESENIHGHGEDYTTAQYRAPDTYEGTPKEHCARSVAEYGSYTESNDRRTA